jgi:hypothetical protein
LITNHWIREKRGMVDFYARPRGTKLMVYESLRGENQ